MRRNSALICLTAVLGMACAGGCATHDWPIPDRLPIAPAADVVQIGLPSGYEARVVASGLMNPSSIAFHPDGTLTVCDSGNGRVVLVRGGRVEPYVTGFATEHWKIDADSGKRRFLLGPLSAVWLDGTTLAVTDAGLPDGREVVRFYDGPGTAGSGAATNSVPPTTGLPGDGGEGNLTGMAVADGGRTIFLCGQGNDARTWVLRCDTTDRRLEPFTSLDQWGVSVNSPMQCLSLDAHGLVLALYSGAGGKDDGLIAAWDREGNLVDTWSLPLLTDPMGMALIPGTHGELAVVDNNWSLTEVRAGRLARVRLPEGGGAADVSVIASDLRGPVACAFGPDGRLYVAELGEAFDAGRGRVIAVWGIGSEVGGEMQAHPMR